MFNRYNLCISREGQASKWWILHKYIGKIPRQRLVFAESTSSFQGRKPDEIGSIWWLSETVLYSIR